MRRLSVILFLSGTFFLVLSGSARSTYADTAGGERGVELCANAIGDVNASGATDFTDAIAVLSHLFLGDPESLAENCAAGEISALEAQLAEQEAALAERDATIAEQEATIAARDMALAERDATIAEQEATIAARDMALAERDATQDDGSCEYAPDGFTFVAENAQGYSEYTHDASGIEFVLLPGGEFEMGSPDTEEGRSSDEAKHTVKLSPFLIAKYEVTQAEYEAVMDGNTAGLDATPSENLGKAPLDPQRPVEQVSWNDLKAADGFLDRTGLSLPSEAQWEYACRAGQSGPYSGTGDLDDMGWYRHNSGGSHHPVGTKQANQFGLFDMHGNVWEWCEDVYDSGFYNNVELRGGPDPVATSGSVYRVIRGGYFNNDTLFARSAFRSLFSRPTNRPDFGFRPARPLP